MFYKHWKTPEGWLIGGENWGAEQSAGELGLSAGQPDPSAVKQAQ